MTASTGIHLICSVGVGRYDEGSYSLTGNQYRTRFAPAALAHLLGMRGGRASVLVTPEARTKWYADVAAELRAVGMEVDAVEIAEGRTEDEILKAFDALVSAVDEGERLVLDVTFSLRHLPFVYLAALTFLTAYKGVTIDGIYYGAWELRDQTTNEAPILDITALFGLTRWYHALQSARDSGDLRPVAELMEDERRRAGGRKGDRFGQAAAAARDMAEALAAGLPVETGLKAARLGETLDRIIQSAAVSPPLRRALAQLERQVRPWATPSASVQKRDLPLTRAELERQLVLAEWYAERNNVPGALVLLREWMVSFLILHDAAGDGWLGRGKRRRAERVLSAIAYRMETGVASDAEGRIGRLRETIFDDRNRFAHAGMRPDLVSVPDAGLAEVLRQCRDLLGREDIGLRRPAGGTVLVTALGHSPGVVYSGVGRVRPDRLVVVTSADAAGRLREALDRAGVAALPVTTRVMADPYAGYREERDIIDDELRRLLVDARRVTVNLTGGTTVMQYVVDRIGDEARRLGADVRRVALVDRRPQEEQRADPYVPGELIELETEEEADGEAP